MSDLVAMIGCDNEQLAVSLRQQLVDKGIRVDARHVVPLKELSATAVLESPAMLFAVLGGDLAGSVAMLREISMTCPAYLVAIGPSDDAKSVVRAMQAGVQDYIDVLQLENGLNDTVGRYRARRQSVVQEAAGGTIWGVISASGGTGCTSVALNLASLLAKKQPNGLVLDFESVCDISLYLGVQPRHNLDDLLASWSKLDDNLYGRILAPTERGFSLLQGGSQAANLCFGITDAMVRRILSFARRRHSWIVIDIGKIEHPAMREAAMRSSRLVLVTRREFVALSKTKGLLDQLGALGLKEDQMVVIANHDGEPGQLSVRESEDLLGRKLDLRLPYSSRPHLTAMHGGSPLVTSQPWSIWAWRLASWLKKDFSRPLVKA
ncbi:MAG: CpaE family protein [Pirellulaceae bacterium]|jgi:Flp pilus assembly CpaE family ATPase